MIEPLHRGFVFGTPMQINLVEGGMARRLNYDAANFNFGGVTMNTPPINLDFSGFRILQRGPGGALREFAIFQGASFFRSNAARSNSRRDGARPVDPHRRPARRGIPLLPRRMDREDRLWPPMP